MNVYAQIDANIVTAILQAATPPAVLPPGRTLVDITTLPDQNILGYTWGGGLIFTPPNEAAVLPADLARIVSKLGA